MKKIIFSGLIIFLLITANTVYSQSYEDRDRGLDEAGFYEDEENEEPFFDDPFLTDDEEIKSGQDKGDEKSPEENQKSDTGNDIKHKNIYK